VSIKNDGHYFCRAGGNRPDGLNEPVTKRQGKKRKFDRIDRQNRSCMMKISYRRHENGKEWFKR
ncbi:hypothetical protein R9N52_18910, partial [Escherichia coli]